MNHSGFSGHSSPITHLETNQQSKELYSSCEKGQLRIFDVQSQKVKRGYKNKSEISDFCIQDNLVYIACKNQIGVFDMREGKSQLVSKDASYPFQISFEDDLNKLCISENGQFLATADDSGSIKVLDIRMNREYKKMKKRHDNLASCVSFRSRNPWHMYSGSYDCKAFLWDFSKGTVIHEFQFEQSEFVNPPFVTCLKEYNSNRLFIGRGNGDIQVMDRDKKHWNQKILQGHSWSITCLDIMNSILISGGLDSTIYIWNANEDSLLGSIAVDGKVNCLTALSDTKVAIGLHNTGTIKVLDLKDIVDVY